MTVIFPIVKNGETIPPLVGLTIRDIQAMRRYARQAEIGGVSHVRDGLTRREFMATDQFVGMCGAMAASKYLFGSVLPFLQAREAANRYPTVGDGGQDFIGLALDIKTSRARVDEKSAWGYHLIVRPGEYHPECAYLLALAYFDETSDSTEFVNVALMGWITGTMMRLCQCDRFGGGAHYETPAQKLNPLMPMAWNWFAQGEFSAG